jgi:hypothetical protein
MSDGSSRAVRGTKDLVFVIGINDKSENEILSYFERPSQSIRMTLFLCRGVSRNALPQRSGMRLIIRTASVNMMPVDTLMSLVLGSVEGLLRYLECIGSADAQRLAAGLHKLN